MITEMDRIKMIIAEGAKKGLVLSKFIDLQIDDFKPVSYTHLTLPTT